MEKFSMSYESLFSLTACSAKDAEQRQLEKAIDLLPRLCRGFADRTAHQVHPLRLILIASHCLHRLFGALRSSSRDISPTTTIRFTIAGGRRKRMMKFWSMYVEKYSCNCLIMLRPAQAEQYGTSDWRQLVLRLKRTSESLSTRYNALQASKSIRQKSQRRTHLSKEHVDSSSDSSDEKDTEPSASNYAVEERLSWGRVGEKLMKVVDDMHARKNTVRTVLCDDVNWTAVAKELKTDCDMAALNAHSVEATQLRRLWAERRFALSFAYRSGDIVRRWKRRRCELHNASLELRPSRMQTLSRLRESHHGRIREAELRRHSADQLAEGVHLIETVQSYCLLSKKMIACSRRIQTSPQQRSYEKLLFDRHVCAYIFERLRLRHLQRSKKLGVQASLTRMSLKKAVLALSWKQCYIFESLC